MHSLLNRGLNPDVKDDDRNTDSGSLTPSWHLHARRIALIYAVFASLWILTSDRTLFHFLADYRNILWVNIAKGIFFVSITSVMLWLLMRQMLMGLERSQGELMKREEEIRESRSRLRALLSHLEQAREEERTRISREVHDVLGQLLTGVKMNLKWIAQRIPKHADDRDALLTKLDETDTFANSILASIQEIAQDLRPGILDRLGLLPALRFEAERFSKRTGIAYQFNTLLESIDLPAEKSTHVFRVVQEMLTNVARHAHANMVTISITQDADDSVILVRDNGSGIPDGKFEDADSLGLLGMQERASLLGGSISIRRDTKGGTTARLTFKNHSA